MEKKTLKDFTPTLRNKVHEYKNRCTSELYSGIEYSKYKRSDVVEYIEKIYSLVNRPKPVIIVAENPNQYKIFYNLILTGKYDKKINDKFKEKNKSDNVDDSSIEVDLSKDTEKIETEECVSHFLYLCSTYHRVYLTWYKFIQDEFKINHSNKETLDWLYERSNNNISRCYFSEKFVLVLRMPEKIHRNSIGFHNTSEGAISWPGYSIYYVNGRKISEELFLKIVKNRLSFEEFINLKNEDEKAAVITIIKENKGSEALMKFLGAEVVDEKRINHSSGYSETVKLWKSIKKFPFLSDVYGNSNQPYCWLELVCPTSGSTYLIDSSAHFTDAIEACKFHRPKSIPAELKYDFSNFNN